MANRNAPRGLVPVNQRFGGMANRLNRYRIASAYDTSIGWGDPVVLTGTGMEIARGSAATAPFCGVFYGVMWTATNGEFKFSRYWPADTATLGSAPAIALVNDDPFTVFEVQADEDIVEGDIGQLADFAFGTVDTVTGFGKTQLDSSNIGTGANAYILDIVRRDDNEVGSNYTKIHILINEHAMRNGGATSIEAV